MSYCQKAVFAGDATRVICNKYFQYTLINMLIKFYKFIEYIFVHVPFQNERHCSVFYGSQTISAELNRCHNTLSMGGVTTLIQSKNFVMDEQRKFYMPFCTGLTQH